MADPSTGNRTSESSPGPDEPEKAQFRLPLPARESFLSFQPEPKLRRPQHPVWTENKAKLIERYLYYFVLVTHHGTYIDGFAGPLHADMPETWAAKLVVESEPRWFRHFYLYDVEKNQVDLLNQLRDAQPLGDKNGKSLNREILVGLGDFNDLVGGLLSSGRIGQKEATFCLLDQHTFECHWSTVKALSDYKRHAEHKIELFYFLAHGWIRRALSAVRNARTLADWWGRDDWPQLQSMDVDALRDTFVSRIRDELGYKSVVPWPIYERQDGGKVMYYMMHATDHPDAPYLMSRAYEKAVYPKETPEQLGFTFETA